MKIVDLTQTIKNDMPVFPGTEKPQLEKVCLFEREGFREIKINMYTHTGTHMDAPAHMLKNGPTLDQLPIDHFIGTAVVIDVSRCSGEIPLELIQTYAKNIACSDFVLFKTHWDKKWGTPEYYDNFPALSVDAAHYLARYSLKGIGVDAISVDLMTSKTFEIHKILLSKNMVMIENLKGLDAIGSDLFILSVMPLNIEDADGSPVRAYAML